jgi:hypothetical protein
MEIDPQMWSLIKPQVSAIWITIQSPVTGRPPPVQGSEPSMQIFITDESLVMAVLDVVPSDTIDTVKSKYKIQKNRTFEEQTLTFGGRHLEDSRTLSDYGISSQSIIQCTNTEIEMVVRKPVIYISSPTIVHAHVSLQLNAAWSFSAIYPTAKINSEEDGRQGILWDVVVKPDGTLTDVASGSEISYLYWEAK